MGLALGVGCIETTEDAASLFLHAIPFNFYPIFAVLFVGLIATGIVKDFGPMKKAEKRAVEEGKVIRDGATPLIGKELTEMQPYPGIRQRVFLNFILPVLVIISIALGTYIAFDSAKTMEAFLFVVIIMTISMMIQGIPFKEVMNTLTDGVKGAIPAVMLLATGSSWGTFAICMPIALPLAFSFTDNQMSLLIVASFAAVAGGGVFGDHCSPLSDTTVLSSTGAASDHIDHVKTQLPYALVCGGLALIAYFVIGIFFI